MLRQTYHIYIPPYQHFDKLYKSENEMRWVAIQGMFRKKAIVYLMRRRDDYIVLVVLTTFD